MPIDIVMLNSWPCTMQGSARRSSSMVATSSAPAVSAPGSSTRRRRPGGPRCRPRAGCPAGGAPPRQQGVADAVAERVVDVLELVEVHEHQRERPVVAARHAGERPRGRQQAAVGQAGEGVDVGQPHQVALHLAELRDVVEDADVVRHRAVGVALLGDRGPAGVEAAVLARRAHLALPVAAGLQRGANLAAHVAAADAEAERGGLLALQLVGVVAADLAEGLVDGDDAAVAVGDDETLAGLLETAAARCSLSSADLRIVTSRPSTSRLGLTLRVRGIARIDSSSVNSAVGPLHGEFMGELAPPTACATRPATPGPASRRCPARRSRRDGGRRSADG